MSNWQNWYKSFVNAKTESELQAFAAGLRGEKYIKPEHVPKFDSTSSWPELISIIQNYSSFNSLDYNFNDGNITSDNSLLLICFEKARKLNSNFGDDQTLNLIIFNYLKSLKIKSILDFIKSIREMPDVIFITCNICNYENEPGWSICANCQTEINNSFDE